MPHFRAPAIATGVLFVVGCMKGTPPDLQAARRGVASADSSWMAAVAAHDLDASANTMTEDGMMLPPDHAPVVGRAAIRKYMGEAFAIPGFKIEWRPVEIHVAASGDVAWERASSSYTFPDSTGAAQTTAAKGIEIWRRDPDGTWRCIVDIWNGMDAPPTPR